MSTSNTNNDPQSRILSASSSNIDIDDEPIDSDSGVRKLSSGFKRNTHQSTQSLVIICSLMIAFVVCVILVGIFYKSPVTSSISGGIILPMIVEYDGIKNIPGKRFAGIESTRTYKSSELAGEIKKVLQATGLPGDIFKTNVPPDKNLAVLLKREFKIYRDNRGEFEQLRKEPVFIDGKVNNDVLSQADEVLSRVDSKRLSVRKMLEDDEQVAYSFEMVNIEGIGDTPDISSAGYLDDYILLEEYAVARAVRDGKIREAIIAIAYVLRLAQLTAEVPSLPVRFIAANTRLKGLDMIQNVVLSKSFTEADLRELYMVVIEQLETWSAESKTFIGHRASGMKTFNLILALGIDYAFENTELEELTKRDKDRFEYRINQNWAWDHVFFLQSMQSLIGECKYPYYKRKDRIDKIFQVLREKYDTPEDLITSYFLLREVPRYMQFFALERARYELAALSMANSLKYSTGVTEYAAESIKSYEKEPITGTLYSIKQIVNESEPKIDIVWGSYFGNMKPFKVPDYSLKEKTAE